jgi:hypothetical protein
MIKGAKMKNKLILMAMLSLMSASLMAGETIYCKIQRLAGHDVVTNDVKYETLKEGTIKFNNYGLV